MSWWRQSIISSSVVPFSSCPQSLPASGSFPMSQLFAWGGQSIGVSASASVISTLRKKKKKKLFIFYWGVASWQSCNNFRWTAKGLSHPNTCTYSSPNAPPFPAATEHWPELHVPYSMPLFIIPLKYSGVYMSIPNSLTIPSPHFSYPATIRLFFKTVSLFLFCKFICVISF